MNLRRKRMMLMDGQWYGYLRTASGNPLTLQNAKRLRKLTIYGNAVQSNLPSGYTEVGYIESSGTQYIDTGICPTNNTKVEAVFSADKNSVFVYGSRTSMGGSDAHGFYVVGQAYFMFGTHMTNTASAEVTQQVKYTVSISQDGGYLDGALKQSYDTMSFESVLPMYLCAMSNNGNVDSRMFDGKIYSFRVWESGKLIQSLVPCKRDSDGAVGMYDTVTGTFLTNSGTGVFAAGAAVTPTPGTPVDIQLCGDKTGNLLDYDVFEDEPDGYVENGSIYVTGYIYQPGITPEDFLEMTGLQVGDEITTTANYKRLVTPSGSNGAEYIIFLRKQENRKFLPLFRPNTVLNLTVPTDFNSSNYYAMFIYGGSTQTDDGSPRSVWSNLAIYKGSYTADTLPAYEPYGYKVSGRAEGLNLFTAEGRTVSDVADSVPSSTRAFGDNVIVEAISSNGYIASSYQTPDYQIYGNTIEVYPASGAGYGIGFDFNVTEGERYSLSFTVLIGKADFSMSYYDADGVYLTRAHLETNTVGVFSSTVPSGAKKMILTLTESYGQTARHIKVTDIMLLQGSYTADTIPPYEPYQPPQEFAVYLPQQIAKVGRVADEVVVDMEKQTAELKKNVGSMTMSDSYSGATSITDELVRFFHATTPQRRISPSANIIDVMSDIYEADTWKNIGAGSTDKQFVIAGNPNTQVVNVRVPKSVIGGETNELMNAWAANNPATVYYVLETPDTTDITSLQQWDAMPQVKGTVTLTLSAEVPPSGAEAVYYSKERGE